LAQTQAKFRFKGALEKEEALAAPSEDDKHAEGWNGTGDNRIMLMNGGNEAGAIYVGKLYISSALQPLRVIFDTGSDYMAVTSELCSQSRETLAQKESEEKNKDKGDEQLFDPNTQATLVNVGQIQEKFLADHRFLQTDYDDDSNILIRDSDPALDAVKKMEDNAKKSKCDTQAYAIKQENEVKDMKSDFLSLKYGSADLGGFLYQDKLCIDPLGSRCAEHFQFIALSKANGLGQDFDGILGLSNHMSESKKSANFIQSLKKSGVIDKAVVTFSVNSNGSYALFGDYNASLVVGGDKGLHGLKTYAYLPEYVGAQNNWALEGQSMFYGDKELKSIIDNSSFPAIIDTGSSTLAVPGKFFESLKKEWESVVKLDCRSNDEFCQVTEQCDEVAKKVKPIGFQMGGQVFEVPPTLYLNQANGICQFGIFKNNLGGDSMNLYIIGEPLLKHLYTVYDFENSEIKLGVNLDSAESGVLIYPPGERPVIKTKE